MLIEITGINHSTLHKITKLLEKFSANGGLSCLNSTLLVQRLTVEISSTKAEAASCSSAMAKLQNAKRKLIPSQRQAREAEHTSAGNQKSFLPRHITAETDGNPSTNVAGANDLGPISRITAPKRKLNMRFWNKHMRQLQREEHRAVSKVRKLRSGRLAVSVNRAERVRKAS